MRQIGQGIPELWSDMRTNKQLDDNWDTADKLGFDLSWRSNDKNCMNCKLSKISLDLKIYNFKELWFYNNDTWRGNIPRIVKLSSRMNMFMKWSYLVGHPVAYKLFSVFIIPTYILTCLLLSLSYICLVLHLSFPTFVLSHVCLVPHVSLSSICLDPPLICPEFGLFLLTI